ncbi:MAG: radical SAM protein [Clostridia bacterium]|nr:radical SAM protein [Clostridia bacterium]
MEIFVKPFDLFEVNGHWFLLKTKSMMHGMVSKEDAALLGAIQGKRCVGDSFQALLERYRLVAQTPWDEEAERMRAAQAYHRHASSDRLAVMELFVAQSCNMGCIYCYGSDGSYHQRGMMTADTARRAIDWFHACCEKPEEAGIVFFGGEPMMNFPVIRESVEYAEKLFGAGKLTYGMATNMTLMTDAQLDFFAALPRMNLLVSIDGPKEIQNRQRPLKDGRDSYEVCAERIRAALDRGIPCVGRATVYADADRDAVVQEMKRLGLSAWQLTAVSGCASDGIRRDDAKQLYQKWLEEFPVQIVRFVEAMKARDKKAADAIMANDDLRKLIIEGVSGARIPRDIVGCSASRSHIAVAANGELYPCHRFVGMEAFCCGTVGEKRDGWREFAHGRLQMCEGCRDCMLRFACSGVCYYQGYTDGPQKSIYSMPPHFCDYTRMRAKLKIYVCHMLDAEDKSWYFTRKSGR